jgi:hypothetical protein
MRKLYLSMVVLVLAMAVAASAARAEDWEKYSEPVPTRVVVRVLAHGAKAMSQHTGALVIIKDAATNKVLDQGDVEGSTGDTTALMDTGYARNTGKTGLLVGEQGVLMNGDDGCKKYKSTDEVAKFVGVVNISKPTQVIIQAQGPMVPHQAQGVAITTTWLFPGENVGGEGIVLDLRGLIVDCLASMKEGELDAAKLTDGIPVPFYMNMMCGCPIAPKSKGLPWEAEDFRITVQAYYKGKLYHEEVTTADKLFVDVSAFKAKVPLPPDLPEGKIKHERVKIRVMASEPKMANYGIDEYSVYLNRR